MLSTNRETDTCVSFGLAFVGGFGDAASFVLAKTFTGHVTGNLVLTAIAVAVHDWRAVLEHLSAIVTFLLGISLSVLIVRPLKARPSLPAIMGIEVILIVAASLALAAHAAHGVELFVIYHAWQFFWQLHQTLSPTSLHPRFLFRNICLRHE